MADADIPYLDPVLGPIGTVIPVPGHRIGPADVRNADALVVRSVTQVNGALLADSSVRFVGSATSGVDHVDQGWLRRQGIEFAHAAGANAESVVEYVLTAIAVGLAARQTSLDRLVIGIVGCGRIGERLARRTGSLGMTVLSNDPPRQRQGAVAPDLVWTELYDLLSRSDIVSVHVPLERGGDHPTVRLVDAEAIDHMKPGAWLIQTSRGGTVDEAAAVRARREERLGYLVLDVWENEPVPRLESISAADIATPHIAGYSRDAKLGGVLRIRDALAHAMNLRLPAKAPEPDELPARGALTVKTDAGPDPTDVFCDVALRLYDILSDDERFRQAPARDDATGESDEHRSERFHALRASYPPRWTFSRYSVDGALDDLENRFLTEGLGVRRAGRAQ